MIDRGKQQSIKIDRKISKTEKKNKKLRRTLIPT